MAGSWEGEGGAAVRGGGWVYNLLRLDGAGVVICHVQNGSLAVYNVGPATVLLPLNLPPVSTQPIQHSAALKLGLVDEVVPSLDQLLPAACKRALDMAEGRQARVSSLGRTDRWA